MRYITDEQYQTLIDMFNQQQQSEGYIDMDIALAFGSVIHNLENQEVKENELLHSFSQKRELLSQYNNYLNMQYQSSGCDDSDISDFFEWINCG